MLEATFHTRQQQVITVRLLGSGTDWGIARPPRPLTVFYDPAHAGEAMSAEDLRSDTDDAVPAAVVLAVLGELVALVGNGDPCLCRRPDR
ncbi:hypothetical protein GTQ99_22640 [Kineococcus sp. T13]|nr:hypothetical protein [Kineococcus vitellinus]